MKWEPALSTHRCALSNMPWLNFSLLMESLQLKFDCWMQINGDDCVDVSTVHCWGKKCKDGEPGRADFCVKQWSRQPVTAANEFHKKRSMNWLRKSTDHSKGNCCQAWHFTGMCGSHYRCSSISECLCMMVCLRADSRDESSESWNLPETFMTLWERRWGISSHYDSQWNKVHHYEPETKHQSGISSQRFTWKNNFSRKTHGFSFLGCRWCLSHGFPWTWDPYQLKALHCNTQNFERMIKNSSEAQEHSAATSRC